MCDAVAGSVMFVTLVSQHISFWPTFRVTIAVPVPSGSPDQTGVVVTSWVSCVTNGFPPWAASAITARRTVSVGIALFSLQPAVVAAAAASAMNIVIRLFMTRLLFEGIGW